MKNAPTHDQSSGAGWDSVGGMLAADLCFCASVSSLRPSPLRSQESGEVLTGQPFLIGPSLPVTSVLSEPRCACPVREKAQEKGRGCEIVVSRCLQRSGTLVSRICFYG